MSASGAAASPAGLWGAGGRSRLAVAVAIGWFFAAGRNDPGDQLVFVSLALGGLGCEVLAVSCWIRDGRRSVRSYRRELFGAVARREVAVPAGLAASEDLVARPEG